MEPNKPTESAPAEPSAPPAAEAPPTATEAAAPLVVGGPAVDPIPLATAVEPAPAVEPPAPEAAPALTAEERERRQAAVAAARDKFLALFRADAKPKPPDLTGATTAYAAALQECPDALSGEWQQLRTGASAETATGHLTECEKLRTDVDRFGASYAALFAGLSPIEQAVAAELDRMKEDDPAFLAAPAEVRDPLVNYKKGLQIIQRMFARLHARRKPLDAIAPDAAAPALAEEAPPPGEWASRLAEFGTAVTDWRTAGSAALRDARKKSDAVRKEVTGFVTAVLGPLDGIEAGLRNEPDLIGRLEPFRADHAPVIDAWVRAYERLDAATGPYFAATGLSPLVVEPGTPFRPETMEPGGTVVRPDRPLEEVVSVMRRGYALHDEQVRPVQVEVVVHTASDPEQLPVPDDTLNPVVGIDLGTTYSSIARWDGERVDVYRMHDGLSSIPSIVHIQENTHTPLVGEMARPRLLTDPANTIEKAKRDIGDETKVYTLRGKPYTPVDISSMVLQRLKQDVEKKFPKTACFDIAGAVITHPHYFKFPQIARTREAAEKAGLPILRLASEPVAAALDYGFSNYSRTDKSGTEKILVFDLGGGTFDVTIIEVINEPTKLTFKVLATGGDDMLGGTNFDEALSQWALAKQGIKFDGLKPETKNRALATLMEQAIKTKRELSSVDPSYLTVPNILPGQHMELEISRGQFDEILKPYCARVRRILTDTMTTARVRSGELNKSLLIGGSSRIPIMEDIVREETGVEAWADADRDLAVCRGAAFLAAMDDGRVTKKEIHIEEVTAHALGVKAAGNVFSIMIPANRPAPVQATRVYTVKSASFEVQPFQGHGRLVTDAGVTALKPIAITGVRLGPGGEADVKITFSVNNQQILFVKIEAPGVSEQRQLEV